MVSTGQPEPMQWQAVAVSWTQCRLPMPALPVGKLPADVGVTLGVI